MSARRGVPAMEFRYNPDTDPILLHRGNRLVSNREDAEEQQYQKEYRRQSNARRVRAELDARERSALGDASLFRVVAAADIAVPEPIAFSKSGLLLCSGVHRINGPAGKGKTRLAYWDILQRVQAGERWAIFDREMGAGRYKQAMIQLGATDANLSSMDYITTEDDVTPNLIRNGRALCRMCLARGCAGILYDSMTPFLAAAGISENDPEGVRAWTDAACRPMAAADGTAIILDHVGHENQERGRGTSDKGAGCDMDMYLSTVTPFSIGCNGAVALTVAKDRSGTLPEGARIRADVRCQDNGDMDFEPRSWSSHSSSDGEGESSVADLLTMLLLRPEIAGAGRSWATALELQAVVPGTKAVKLERIADAVSDGSILLQTRGNAKRYSLPDEDRG